MPIPAYNCRNIDVDSARSKKIFNEEELSDTQKRLDVLLRRLSNTEQPVSGARTELSDAASKAMQSRFRRSVNLANTISLSPRTGRNFQYLLALDWGVRTKALGLSDSLTEAGSVLEALTDARRLGRGNVHQILAQIEMVGKNLDAYNNIKFLQRKYNIPQNTFDEITTRAVEIGWHPYLQQGMRIGPEGIRILQNEQSRFFKQLRELGFIDHDINLLGREASAVSDVYMETLEIAKQVGINVDAVQDINYFPRLFSAEASVRFEWKQVDDFSFSVNGGPPQSLSEAFITGRNTFHFVVEDEILLDHILRNAEPGIYKTLGVQGVRDLFDDNRKLGAALFNHLSEGQLNQLIDSGLISKLPMNSVEVFEHLKEAYELPFEGIRELMAVDWKQAANLYRRQLEQLASQSEMVNLAARSAIDGGWGVTEAQRLADPDQFAQYRKLSDVIPPAMAKRFSLDPNNIAGVYIHPIASDLFRAQFDVGTNPNALATIAKMFQDMGTVFQRTVLSTTGFVGRQLNNIAFQVWAAGGDITEYAMTVPRGFSIIIEAHNKGKPIHEFFTKRLDDTRKIQGMTERGIWEAMQRQGLLNEIMPWSGEDIARTYSPNDGIVRNIARHARYMNNVFQQFDQMSPPRAFRAAYDQITRTTGELTGDTFYAFQLFNAEFENLARFATVKSLMDASPVGRIRRGLQGNVGRALTFDEALDRMKEYFYFYDDLGRSDKTLSRWVVPFWSFVSRNTFAQFRHMLRNPSRFVAYNRLYAALNAPAEEQGDDLPLGAVRDWARDSRPLYWVRENDQGEEEYFALPLRSLDPISDGIATVTDIGDSVLRLFGIWPDSQFPSMGTGDRLAETPWGQSRTNTALENLLSNTFPQWKLAYAALSGKDVGTEATIRTDETGRQFSSFLGFETEPWVRYALETSIPLLANVNRSNPFGVFGRAPLYDNKTGEELDPGELSIFGVERSRRDVVSDYRATWQRVAAAVGFNFREIDVAYGMGMTEQQILFNLLEGQKAIRRAERDATTIQDPNRLREQLERIEQMKLLWTQLRLDHARFENWRKVRGYEPRAGIRSLTRQGLSIRQLETLTELQERKIIEEVYGIQDD